MPRTTAIASVAPAFHSADASLPVGGGSFSGKHLAEACPRPLAGIRRRRVEWKKLGGCDFAVGKIERAPPLPGSADKERHMVARISVGIAVKPEKLDRTRQDGADFLADLAHQRRMRTLADLNAAAGKIPAAHIR